MSIDGRALDHQTLEHLRITACTRVAAGERPSAVMTTMGFCRTTIYRWLDQEKRKGQDGLRSRKSTGPKRRLGVRKQRQLRRMILTKDPRDFGYAEALWTRAIIGELIENKFGVKFCVSAVGKLLALLGITPQKPLRRAYERDPGRIEAWQKEEYPKIRARAKRRNADILFLDEAGILSDAALQATWGEKGRTPIVKTSGQRQKINIISAVNPLGAFWYITYTCKLDAEFFVACLGSLIRGKRRPTFVIMDGHPVHRSRAVSKFVQLMAGQLEIYFLPPYAPDLNPDEFVWNYLRQHGVTKKPLKKNESLVERVHKDLNAVRKRPGLVRSFFKAKSVAYTSA
jgi:transposase